LISVLCSIPFMSRLSFHTVSHDSDSSAVISQLSS